MHAQPVDPRDVLQLEFKDLAVPNKAASSLTGISGITDQFVEDATSALEEFDMSSPGAVKDHADKARSALETLKLLSQEVAQGAERDVLAVSMVANLLDAQLTKLDYWLLKNIESVEKPWEEVTKLGVEVLCEASRRKYPFDYNEKVAAAHALTVNRFLVESDRAGHPTHGWDRIEYYVKAIRDGHINPFGEVKEVHRAGQFIRFNGGKNFGQVAMLEAVNRAIAFMDEEALSVAEFAISNMYHAGRLGDWAALAAKEGFIAHAILTVGGDGRVAPFGRSGIALGTNPIAIALPHEPTPIVADTTTAAEVEGMLRLAAKFGLFVPSGIIQTWDGVPTRDPQVLYVEEKAKRGSILNLAGHRGHALSTVAVLVNSILNERPIEHELVAGENEVTMRLTRANAVSSAAFQSARVEHFQEVLNSTYPQDGAPVFLPGLHGYSLATPYRQRGVVPIAQQSWERLSLLRDRPEIELFGA